MWLLPLVMLLGAAVDLALMVTYLKWFHPWKIILQQVTVGPALEISQYSIVQETETWKKEQQNMKRDDQAQDAAGIAEVAIQFN